MPADSTGVYVAWKEAGMAFGRYTMLISTYTHTRKSHKSLSNEVLQNIISKHNIEISFICYQGLETIC